LNIHATRINDMKKTSLMIAAAALGLAAGPVVLASDPAEPNGEPQAAEAQEVAQSAAEASIPETLRHKDRATSVMDTPLDGSSLETFTAGLKRLDEEASETDYRRVMSSLDFLLFYDIGARRDRAKLYSRLNGKTPNEIIQRVEDNRKSARPGQR
jgi:hypothetical protein